VRRDTAWVMTGGGPASWLGANFWSPTGSPLMWRSYDPDVIRAEVKPALPPDERLADLDDELTVDTVILGPFEIKILKILRG